MRNIHKEEAIVNLAKIFHTQIKNSLQYNKICDFKLFPMKSYCWTLPVWLLLYIYALYILLYILAANIAVVSSYSLESWYCAESNSQIWGILCALWLSPTGFIGNEVANYIIMPYLYNKLCGWHISHVSSLIEVFPLWRPQFLTLLYNLK